MMMFLLVLHVLVIWCLGLMLAVVAGCAHKWMYSESFTPMYAFYVCILISLLLITSATCLLIGSIFFREHDVKQNDQQFYHKSEDIYAPISPKSNFDNNDRKDIGKISHNDTFYV